MTPISQHFLNFEKLFLATYYRCYIKPIYLYRSDLYYLQRVILFVWSSKQLRCYKEQFLSSFSPSPVEKIARVSQLLWWNYKSRSQTQAFLSSHWGLFHYITNPECLSWPPPPPTPSHTWPPHPHSKVHCSRSSAAEPQCLLCSLHWVCNGFAFLASRHTFA